MSVTLEGIDSDRAYEARSLVRMLDKLLVDLVAGFENYGITLPGRRYWTLGTPAADCEQVVISLVQTYIGPPGDEATSPQRCDAARSATVTIQVIRCVPVISPRGAAPTPDQIQTASEALAVDLWVTLDLISALDQWDSMGGPGLGVIATGEAGEPQGGFQGVTVTLTMAVP